MTEKPTSNDSPEPSKTAPEAAEALLDKYHAEVMQLLSQREQKAKEYRQEDARKLEELRATQEVLVKNLSSVSYRALSAERAVEDLSRKVEKLLSEIGTLSKIVKGIEWVGTFEKSPMYRWAFMAGVIILSSLFTRVTTEAKTSAPPALPSVSPAPAPFPATAPALSPSAPPSASSSASPEPALSFSPLVPFAPLAPPVEIERR